MTPHYTVVQFLERGHPTAYSLARDGVPCGVAMKHDPASLEILKRQAEQFNRAAPVRTIERVA